MKTLNKLIEDLVEEIEDYDFVNKFNSMQRYKTEDSIRELLDHGKIMNMPKRVYVLPDVYGHTEGEFEFKGQIVEQDFIRVRDMADICDDKVKVIEYAYSFIDSLKKKVTMPRDFERVILCKTLVLGKELEEMKDSDVIIELFIDTIRFKLNLESIRFFEKL